jgi:hypothetical protein
LAIMNSATTSMGTQVALLYPGLQSLGYGVYFMILVAPMSSEYILKVVVSSQWIIPFISM